jgi:hypothetical protein
VRLLRISEMEIGPNDRVFCHARLLPLLLWLAAFCADAAMLFDAITGKWKPGYIFGPVFLLFLLLFLRFVTPRFHPSNWLVRVNETGLFAQYRSYLNYQLPADDSTVVFISYGEIASARLIRERVQTPDPVHSGATQTQFLRYIELELASDTTPLASALQVEISAKPLMRKRWYGSGSTLYRDYPLTMNTPPFLRIRWNVVPRASRFLGFLRQYITIADPVALRQDFTQLQSLGHEEQQKQLRELAVRGEVIAAIYIARKLYGCSLGEATMMVDRLTDRQQPA